MDFTREPIIETVITPKEGCKLVVRSSKSSAQEEYFVDAVEVVSFGNSFFFRSLERPKAFLVPASDYEILEVREARMVLKNVGLDRSIKIGGGRETPAKAPKEVEKVEQPLAEAPVAAEAAAEGRLDKKRDRRSRYRRRRGREETVTKEGAGEEAAEEVEKIELAEPRKAEAGVEGGFEEVVVAPPSPLLSSLLPPPPTLISETIARYKDNAMFRGSFFLRDEEKEGEEKEGEEGKEDLDVPLAETHLSPFEMTESEQEFYRERSTTFTLEDEPYQPPFEEKPSGVSEEPADTNGNH